MSDRLGPDTLRAKVNEYFFDGLPPKELARTALDCAAAWEADIADAARWEGIALTLRERLEEAAEAMRSLLTDCEAEAVRRGFRPEDFDNIKAARSILASLPPSESET